MAESPVSNDSTNVNKVEERRHSSLYFADGDIVVSATSERRDKIYFFRVDKVFLGRHSIIFRDMFVVGDSDPQMERYDGVPKVHLPDYAEDVAGFLNAIYDITTLPFSEFPCHDEPFLVQGIMRLAVKYEVEAIRTTILKRIESQWPQTLEEWERRYINRVRNQVILSPETPEEEMEVYFPDPALAVRFALEFDCPKIFPAALYELVSAYKPEASRHPTPYTISWECLHAADMRRVVAVQRMLADESMRIVTAKWGCGCKVCSPITHTCALAVLRDRQEDDFFDTLLLLRCFHQQLVKRHGEFCDPSYRGTLDIESAIVKKAQTIWDSLSGYFDDFDPNYPCY